MLSSIYKVGDLYTYNNRAVPDLNDTLVYTSPRSKLEKHEDEFLKNGE